MPRSTALAKRAAAKPVESRIIVLRGQKVILDSDLAELYGVEGGHLNQQVKRNARRFPQDFFFQVTARTRAWRDAEIAVVVNLLKPLTTKDTKVHEVNS